MLKKPEKLQEEPIPHNNRIKLPKESGIRTFAGIKELLTMSQNPRGCQVELEWTTKNPGQIFVLDVQWDASMDDPFWCLYEQNDGKSKTIWSQFFAAADIEMFYDILVMSCGAVDPSKKLSDILKSQPNSEKDSAKLSENKTAPAANSATKLPPVSQDNSSTPPVSNPSSESNPNPNPAGFVPPYGFPPGMAVPGVPYPMPPFNMPPNMVLQPNMMPQPNMQAMPVPMPYPSNMNPPAFPSLFQQVPTDQANMSPSSRSGGEVLSALPMDASLFDKQNDIALVDLLIKAELITETALAAALKIQDLIHSKRLNIEKASKILKRHNSKGSAIENYIDSTVSLTVDKPVSEKSVSVKKNKQEEKDTLTAFELLQNAGLLSQQDIKTAKGVSLKHGGDIISILKAAQKIDEQTLDAAKICQALEKEGKMKLEQSVILLNYCSRSRVSFDEALSELNWPDPRTSK